MASVVRALNATKHRNLIWAKKRFMRSNDIEKVLKDQIKKVNHVLTKLNVNLCTYLYYITLLFLLFVTIY